MYFSQRFCYSLKRDAHFYLFSSYTASIVVALKQSPFWLRRFAVLLPITSAFIALAANNAHNFSRQWMRLISTFSLSPRTLTPSYGIPKCLWQTKLCNLFPSYPERRANFHCASLWATPCHSRRVLGYTSDIRPVHPNRTILRWALAFLLTWRAFRIFSHWNTHIICGWIFALDTHAIDLYGPLECFCLYIVYVCRAGIE